MGPWESVRALVFDVERVPRAFVVGARIAS